MICPSIVPEKSKGLLFFHAFTGCDVVSAFRGKGKRSAWQTWNVCPEASTVYRKLSQYLPVIGEDDQSILEKFVVTMYDRSSATDSIDAARLELFARKQRSYDSIPPNINSPYSTYKACCIPSRLHMGPSNYVSNGIQQPCGLGLEKAR
jgi:hypothetical protein